MYDTWMTRHPAPARRSVHADAAVVSRRIGVGAVRLTELLEQQPLDDLHLESEGVPRGRLVLDGALEPTPLVRPTWAGAGRLYGRGPRIARYARVHVWISAWSDDAVELQIRPVCRYPFNWGRRRRRRYFELAHLAADHVWLLLARAGAPPVAEPPSSPAVVPSVRRRVA